MMENLYFVAILHKCQDRDFIFDHTSWKKILKKLYIFNERRSENLSTVIMKCNDI